MKRTTLSKLGQRTPEPPISWLMHTALARPRLISLAAGFTDSESLPVEDVRELLDELLSVPRTGRAALQYGTTQGDLNLRQLTSRHLSRLDDASASDPAYAADRMIITSGSQQLLYMATEALCDPGDIVLVEDPTYFVYLGILQSHGVEARGLRMDREGLNLQRLEETLERMKASGDLKRVKMLYLVSYFQNPTGITTSMARKEQAMALLRRYERAAGHPIYVLEDAAYRELRFAGNEIRSCLSLKGGVDRVIYTGTFSKPFATGMRIGYGLVPKEVFTTLIRIKGNHDFGSSNLLQQLMAQALASGRYDRHRGALLRRYREKAGVMAESMRRHFPGDVDWIEPEGGLYFWARIPGRKTGMNSKLFQAALENDVLYVPGLLCYATDPTRTRPDCEMRLSFGGASNAKLAEGIRRLGEVLR